MGHVTFVHGMANKPERDVLLAQWRVALLDDDGLDLDAMGVTASMVYWADILYGMPAPVGGVRESAELELAAALCADDADMSWLGEIAPAERGFVIGLAREVGLTAVPDPGRDDMFAVPPSASAPSVPSAPSAWEALPLPWWLKERLIRVFLRDVHHYLFDVEVRPRPGALFRVRRDVRARALEALQEGASRPGPHIIVGHSLGTVIAYDVLTAVDEAPRVDALMTVGSPLVVSEVQQKLAPPWTSGNGWPEERLGDGPWFNVYDPLDPVCGGLDRKIAEDYRWHGQRRVVDIAVSNRGSWRHSMEKYLGQEKLRSALRAVLE